jgi:hypothetical protein
VVELEALQQTRHRQMLAGALDEMGDHEVLAVCILAFLLDEEPGPPIMDTPQCVAWLRAGMPEAGLDRGVRPALAHARTLAQRFLWAVESGEPVDCGKEDPDLVDWCCWLAEGSRVE